MLLTLIESFLSYVTHCAQKLQKKAVIGNHINTNVSEIWIGVWLVSMLPHVNTTTEGSCRPISRVQTKTVWISFLPNYEAASWILVVCPVDRRSSCVWEEAPSALSLRFHSTHTHTILLKNNISWIRCTISVAHITSHKRFLSNLFNIFCISWCHFKC